MNFAYAKDFSVAAALVATPAWLSALQSVNTVLGTVSVVLGIIVGIHTLYNGRRDK